MAVAGMRDRDTMAVDWVPPEPIRPDEPIITPATPPDQVPAWLRAHHEAAGKIEERRQADHGKDQEPASEASPSPSGQWLSP